MRLLGWFLFVILPLTVVILIGAFAIYGVEKQAAVTVAKAPTPADAARAKSFAKRTIKQVVNAKSATVLTVTEKDLDSAFALMNRAVRRLKGDATVTRRGLDAAITLNLPQNPLGKYVNVRIGVPPSTDGLEISRVSVGAIKLTGAQATTVLRHGLNFALGDNLGDDILAAVRSARFASKSTSLRIVPVDRLKDRLKVAGRRLADVRDDVALLGDPARIRIYYAKLAELDQAGGGTAGQSLVSYTKPLFQLAQSRGGDAAGENQAAILALVIYFGDPRFERLTGKVRTGSLRGHRRRNGAVTLDGRQDLLLHFIISAGLQLVSDHSAAMAIGEFKELLDSTGGGSGFSFADLGADRAGIRFANVATGPAAGARRLQAAMAKASAEDKIFPRFRDLPERMSDAAFKQRYGGVEDPRYRAVVDEIDRRIAALPPYLQ